MEEIGLELMRYYTRLAGGALHGECLHEWEGHGCMRRFHDTWNWI